jgi:hypothetical protein
VTGEGLPLLLEAVWKKLVEHEAGTAGREAREAMEPPQLAPHASRLDNE